MRRAKQLKQHSVCTCAALSSRLKRAERDGKAQLEKLQRELAAVKSNISSRASSHADSSDAAASEAAAQVVPGSGHPHASWALPTCIADQLGLASGRRTAVKLLCVELRPLAAWERKVACGPDTYPNQFTKPAEVHAGRFHMASVLWFHPVFLQQGDGSVSGMASGPATCLTWTEKQRKRQREQQNLLPCEQLLAAAGCGQACATLPAISSS